MSIFNQSSPLSLDAGKGDSSSEASCQEHSAFSGATCFVPSVPKGLDALNISPVVVEDLIFKVLLNQGSATGREIAGLICLHFPVVESLLADLKNRLLVAHQAGAGVGDFVYRLTGAGQEKALLSRESSAYSGSVPVAYKDYLFAMQEQSIRKEKPNRQALEKAFEGLVFDQGLFDTIGPAINSGRGLFLYGEPGNGKTTIAERISRCFTGTVYIPKTLYIEGQIVQLFDPQNHEPVVSEHQNGLISKFDQRWVEIKRPAVMVGGELMMDSLEVKFNPVLKVSEAPLQMKANGGIFLIDDFGRQRMSHVDLLNRWIVPLEKRVDFLTLPNGQKISVPFDELIIFSTNLDPKSLVDDAFLRRVPYKIHVKDPSEEDYTAIFKLLCSQFGVPYDATMLAYLIDKHYRGKRPFRGCQPRDLLQQVLNMADYTGELPVLSESVLDRACQNYFSAMGSD